MEVFEAYVLESYNCADEYLRRWYLEFVKHRVAGMT